MIFSVKFDKVLIFQGFKWIFSWKVVIFDEVKSGEMLYFSGFARSGYRSIFGDFYSIFGVDVWMEQICRSWLPAVVLKM